MEVPLSAVNGESMRMMARLSDGAGSSDTPIILWTCYSGACSRGSNKLQAPETVTAQVVGGATSKEKTLSSRGVGEELEVARLISLAAAVEWVQPMARIKMFCVHPSNVMTRRRSMVVSTSKSLP